MLLRTAKIFLVTLFLVVIAGCSRKDNCATVVCPAGQGCSQGQCYCADGYEGSDCSTLSIQKFLTPSSSYFVNINCYGNQPPFGVSSYNASMAADTDPRIVHIYGVMGGICNDIIGYIRTDRSNQGNIIEVNQQSCGGTTISGQGTWDPINRQLIFNFDITSNGTYQCTHTFYQQ